MCSKTLSRWLLDTLTMSGVNMEGFCPHAARSASAAYHKEQKLLSVREICARANWSETLGVYQQFYERFIA